MSKSRIDRLGERLRDDKITEADLELLDTYRRSFTKSYEVVIKTIRDRLSLEPTGRPAKSTTSVIEKLRRESIRLTQVQDIAGCRVVVDDIVAQDKLVDELGQLFDEMRVVDRRQAPSHGYRAVHVIVDYNGKPIEIQIRTSLQHLWSELSEKFSDVVDPLIKYGGGDKEIQSHLAEYSQIVAGAELNDKQLFDLENQISSGTRLPEEIREGLTRIREGVNHSKQSIAQVLKETNALITKREGEDRALSD